MDERRNFQRVPFATTAEFNYQDQKYLGELLNISLQGALVLGKGAIPLAAGDRCELVIYLMDSEITLQFDADIVHRQKNRFGFKFIHEDTETAIHLTRLLELNVGSPDFINKEVAFWLKNN